MKENTSIKRAILQRAAGGALIGMALCNLIAVCFSLGVGEGRYISCPPSLTAQMPNELSAVILQYGMAMLCGGGWAAISVVWDYKEDWGLLRQILFHCGFGLIFTLIPAYFAHWMKHSWGGFWGYVLLFVVVYVIMGGIFAIYAKKQVEALEEGVRRRKKEKDRPL